MRLRKRLKTCNLMQYGQIRAIDIKLPPRPPPFAFVEYDDPR
jgi:hypothetical protein